MLSTQEVAAMLDVTETTIKRWADETLLACVRTAGGHRKFLLRDIVQFAEANGYTVGGARPPELSAANSERLQVGVYTRNHQMIASVFQEEALGADRRALLDLLLYLHKQRIPFPAMVDEIIRPAFQAIGTLWVGGNISIAEEHAASQATMEALVLLSAELHHKSPNGLSALCACPGPDLHELGLRALAYSLECEGWKVHFLGANTPSEMLIERIRTTGAELVCLSISAAEPDPGFMEQLRRMAETVHAYGGKIIIGGGFAPALSTDGIHCDSYADSVTEAIRFSKDAFGLKPGPKKGMTAVRKK